MELIDGIWYIKVTGDYAGVISGRVFDISRSTDPVTIDLEVLDNVDCCDLNPGYGLEANTEFFYLYLFKSSPGIQTIRLS